MPAPKRMPRISFGIPVLDAWLETMADRLDQVSNLTVGGGLSMSSGPTGTRIIGSNPERRMTVKLTASSGGGGYTAVEVKPASGGGFSAVSGGWTGNVYEFNGLSTIPVNSYVEVTYFRFTDDWRFQSGSCS